MTIEATAGADGLELAFGSARRVVSWRWVRDHCEDPAHFNAATRQRRVNVLNGNDIGPAEVAGISNDQIMLRWSDGTEGWLNVQTLRVLLEPEPPRTTGWASGTQPDLSIGSVSDVLVDDDALASWLGDLSTWGVGRLRGFDGDVEAVEELVGRIGYPRRTIFGDVWRLASTITDHEDTAYSEEFLGPHTDGTYSHDAPGLQIFCCLERDGDGGESILVDGFAAADEIGRHHPEWHELLTRVAVPAHYVEPGIDLRAARPLLRLGADGAPLQVSFNNYDRSPLLLDPGLMDTFYDAYGEFHRVVNDRDRWLEIRLEPGDVLAVDNWRVLHGRHAYRGPRTFLGCYVNHEDFESRCRILGI